jgi:tetratricopeptide (TPR) repeat protein
MGDPKAGLAAYQKAWSLDPRSRIIGYNLAYRLSGMGELDKAIRTLEEVLEFAPDFPDALGLMMQLKMYTGQCGPAEDYAQQLAATLNKQNPAIDLYRDVCQDQDPQLRRQAFETIMAWGENDFANPDHPTLFYDVDMVNALVHFGLPDALWEWLEGQGDDAAQFLPGIRIYRTEQGIRLQCDPRIDAMASKYNIPPPVDPVACN